MAGEQQQQQLLLLLQVMAGEPVKQATANELFIT